MAGTILVGEGVSFDIRTVDFEWIVDELRTRRTSANQATLDELLITHDLHGVDMLIADELDADGLDHFARALDSFASDLDDSPGAVAMCNFLKQVSAAIRRDPRCLER